MPQPSTIIDAPAGETTRHGSFTATFSTGGVLTIEELSWTKGTRALRSTDAVGKPHKAAYVAEWGEGTATVQLKTASTRIAAGETFSFLDTDGTTTISAIVTKVNGRWHQNEITKISIDFAEKVN